MNRSFNKFIVYLLVGIFAFSFLPISAFAETNHFTYVTEGTKATITGYNGTGDTIEIPTSLDGLAVTKIGDHAFSSASFATIIIQDTIQEIGNGAFSANNQLKKAYFSGNQPIFGNEVFSGTGSDFKVYFHISKLANWSAYNNYNKQAYCLLTLHLQDGKDPNTSFVDVNNGSITQPFAPTRTGFTFDGWYIDPEYKTIWSNENINNDIDIYAKWNTNSYTVTFNSKGGSNVQSIVASELNAKITEPSVPSKVGYTFAGWFKEEACTNLWSFNTDTVDHDITLYAKWDPIQTFTVTCDSMGGSSVNAVQTQSGSKIAEPLQPLKNGYTFGGWYKEESLTAAWNFNTDKVIADTTLYAKWTSNGTSFSGSGTAEDPFGISSPDDLYAVRNNPSSYFVLLNDIDMSAVTAAGGAYYNNGAGWVPIGTYTTPFSGVFDGNKHKITGLKLSMHGTNTVYAGLFGYLTGTVKKLGLENGSFTADTTGSYQVFIGAIAGYTKNAAIQQCYSTSAVNVSGSHDYYSGGITGYASNGSISDCLNTGFVYAASSYAAAGGIAGFASGTSISTCYNAGMVSAGTSGTGFAFSGALTGNNSCTFSNCYNIDLNYKSTGVVGGPSFSRTDAQLRQGNTYSGFDFDNVWTITGNSAYPYAELKGMPISVPDENTTSFAGGSGTCYAPYKIETVEQLDNIRNYGGVFFALQNDIDLTGFIGSGSWNPIGTQTNPFTGNFNGKGHKLSGLYIDIANTGTNPYAGLFGYLSGTVANLTIQSGSISDMVDYACVGGIAGYAAGGTIVNCTNNASVSSGTSVSTNYAGGIAGRASAARIQKCGNAAKISSYRGYAAGIAGAGSRGLIDQCQNSGFITGTTNATGNYDFYSGGIAGAVSDYFTVSNCINTGRVLGDYAGGISVSCDNSKILYCYNAGFVYGGDFSGPASATQNSATFTNCYYLDALLQVGYTGNPSGNANIKAKTDADFKQQATFVGFDFENVWTMAGNETYPYPEIRGMEMPAPPENLTDFAGGRGTYYAPYRITTPIQLDSMRDFSGNYFLLQNDIDLSQYIAGKPNQSFEPIGGEDSFDGIFWGNGHKITGLKQTLSAPKAGLFGHFCGFITQLGMEGVNISVTRSSASAGALAGSIGGTVYQCWSTGKIQATCTDTATAGGITGGIYGGISNQSQILNCCNMATVNTKNSRYDYIGGVVGNLSNGNVQNCINSGTLWGITNIGGIVGSVYSTNSIKYCYNAGIIHGNRSAGAIAASGSISNCCFLDNIPRMTGWGTDLSSARSDAQLRQQSGYTGFDFDAVWTFKQDSDYPYAQLQNINVPVLVTDNPDFAGGDGTSYSPFIITNAVQLNKMREYPDSCFELANDIDISSQNWEPVGTAAIPFTGYLNGKRHRISGLHISISGGTTVYAGLFGYLTGTVKNLKISDASITVSGTTVYVGVLCGYSLYSYIQNCLIGGSVATSGDYNYTGGIAGYEMDNYLSRCQNNASIQCTNSLRSNIGGISGYHKGYYMLDCFNTGNIVNDCTDIYHYTGGITGYMDSGSIATCYNTGLVTAKSGQQDYAGGIIGSSNMTAQNCYFLDNNVKGIGNGSPTGISKKTDAEMRLQSTFTGFDFVSIWTIGYDENYGYPKLIALEGSSVCKVSFSLNGHGTPNPAIQNIPWGLKVIKPTDPQQAGYSFEGWYKEQDCINKWNFDTDTVMSDMTLYAKWRQLNYTVTLNSMGGTPVEAVSTTYGLKIGEPVSPAKQGYLLCGWYKEEACINKWIFNTDTVTSDITLYALWTENGAPFTGSGTAEDPYRISTPTQLNEVRQYLSSNFILANDIDMGSATTKDGIFYNNGNGFIPIGDSASPFTGVFDGSGFCIKNLHVKNPADGYAGLFGKNSGMIKRMGLLDCEIIVDGSYSQIYVGSIAGGNSGTIRECYNSGHIMASCYYAAVGGISNGGTIEKCFSTCTVSAYGYYGKIGGITGSGGTVRECYTTGSITLDGHDVGAISGWGGNINNCYYTNPFLRPLPVGFGSATNTFLKTPEEMSQQDQFEGFDFTNTWEMSADPGFPCPVLKSVQFDLGSENTTDFAGGRGTYYDPYKISTPSQLNNIRKQPGAHYKLTGNIDLTTATSSGGSLYDNGSGWAAIGEDLQNAFCGSINGGGHVISGLKSHDATGNGAALIYKNDGQLLNIGLKDVDIYSHGCAAGFTLSNDGMIDACYTTGTIYGQDDCGGIAAYSDGTIVDCYNAANITSQSSFDTAGGIVGASGTHSEIHCCYNTGNVRVTESGGSGTGYAGGINGQGSAKIFDCFNTGSVTVENDGDYAGGIVGGDFAEIYRCYNAGTICGSDNNGAIVSRETLNTIVNTYFLDTGEGWLRGAGTYPENTELSSKVTHDQMTSQSTFAGFDFKNIWEMPEDGEYRYPVLKNVSRAALEKDTVNFAGGLGLKYYPYLISTPKQLDTIRNFSNRYFMLANDIDLTAATSDGGAFYNGGAGWLPIDGLLFQVHLDGNGHTISGLHINRPQAAGAGLFGSIYHSSIKNLTLEDVSITAADNCGGLAGYLSDGTIENCLIFGEITGTQGTSSNHGVGGFIGQMEEGIISDCLNYASVKGTISSGGIGGSIEGDILRCVNYGYVNGTTGSAGGITGCEEGHIKDCFNTAEITAGRSYLAGGISGWHSGGSSYTYENCYNVGKSGYGLTEGGNSATWINSYYLGSAASYISIYGTSKTAEELKQQATYTGFDFANVWQMDAGSLPILKNKPFVHTTGITLDHSTLALNCNSKLTLTAIVAPVNANMQNVIWTTDNAYVATVSATGEISGLHGGIATITASTLDGSFSDTCTVTVLKAVTGISLNKNYAAIGTGEEEQLTAAITPQDATNKKVIWTSSDNNIATVDTTGKVKALTTGTVTITAKSDDGGYKANCRYNVVNHVTGVLLDKESIILNEGQTQTLVAHITPEDATDKDLIWISSKPDIATVDQNGKVTAVCGDNSATITVRTIDGSFIDTCTVTVNEQYFTLKFETNGGTSIEPRQIRYNSYIEKPVDPVKEGYSFAGWCIDADCTTEWLFNNYKVFRDVTLYAKWTIDTPVTPTPSNPAPSNPIPENTVNPVSISCQKTDATLYGASNGTITITASGGNSGLYKYSINGGTAWQDSGYFGSIAAGTYTAMVCDANNTGNTASTSVTVGQPKIAGSYSANKIPANTNAGTTIAVTPPPAPKGSTINKVTYKSSNNSIATVDENGNVTFLRGGKIKLTVTVTYQVIKNGKVTTKTTSIIKQITVNQLISNISLNKTEAAIAPKKTLKLKAVISPSSATNKKLTWKSSNNKIATVSGAGVVTAKAKGTVVITCIAQDKSRVSASCTITVN